MKIYNTNQFKSYFFLRHFSKKLSLKPEFLISFFHPLLLLILLYFLYWCKVYESLFEKFRARKPFFLWKLNFFSIFVNKIWMILVISYKQLWLTLYHPSPLASYHDIANVVIWSHIHMHVFIYTENFAMINKWCLFGREPSLN